MGPDEFFALLHERGRRTGRRRSRSPRYQVQSCGILWIHVDERPDDFACSLPVFIPVGAQFIGIGVGPECDSVYLCHGECLTMVFLEHDICQTAPQRAEPSGDAAISTVHGLYAVMAAAAMLEELVLLEVRLWLAILRMTLIAFVLQERFDQPGVGKGT